MKLKKITLYNFRQFQDERTIKFLDGEKNITIIFGENGKGKTGIFRALIFGIFGLTKLPQDDLNTKLHLVNLFKLNENINNPVEAKVEVEFEHSGTFYKIERKIVGIKSKEKIDERVVSSKLVIINRNDFSEISLTDEREIKDILRNILNDEIKDFFLFDGEKIEALAKTNAESRKDIKKGITKLLHIENLEKAIFIIKELYKKQEKKIRLESSNNDLKKLGDKLEVLEENKNEEIEKMEHNTIEMQLCANEIESIEKKLAENQDIKVVQYEINSLEKDILIQKSLLIEKKNQMRKNILNKTYSLLLNNIFEGTKEYLDQIYFTQKDNIPISVIEKILKEKKCLCGTDLLEVNSALENIKKLKDNYERSNMSNVINKITNSYYDFYKDKETLESDIKKVLEDIRALKDQIDELELKKEKYSDDIKELSKKEKNLEELEKTLESKQKFLSNIKFDIRRSEERLESMKKEISKKSDELKKAQENDQSLRKSYEKLSYLETMSNSLEEVYTKYTTNMREQLQKNTTDIFKKMIDPKDREVIIKVEINDKYEIDIIGWNGTKITQDISQGQRQMVALSFVTALAKIASGSKESIDFPLFMDTPFGRLSGNNRDNLIEHLPNLTSQWILLLTDTEYTASEEFKLKSTGKLGMMYKLVQIEPGNTQIMEVSSEEILATRRI